MPNLEGREAVRPVDLLQDGIAQLPSRLARVRSIADQLPQGFAGVAIHQEIDIGHNKEPMVFVPDDRAGSEAGAGPGRVERLHQAVLAVVDRATDTAVEKRREVRGGRKLDGKPEFGAVSLRQMCLERIEAAPD